MRSVIRDIISWIESDLSKPMRSSDIAEKAGYSRWHLQRSFKYFTGYTLGRYIRARRMTVAAVLLKSTDLSITSIYLRVGYDEAATFCRVFCRHFGLSPSAYRSCPVDFPDRMQATLTFQAIAETISHYQNNKLLCVDGNFIHSPCS
ncbi:helix-turn-helix domain-containing protein [Klebsiella aerogenes]|uniref:helix-turn-helix domain-containing protein n=1 Tax=Klebsiella aerogenes TaxID=548 RepID=UPI001F3AA030|nr:helix-turn-helix domain-containing protein [Klebsiella aerogenes]